MELEADKGAYLILISLPLQPAKRRGEHSHCTLGRLLGQQIVQDFPQFERSKLWGVVGTSDSELEHVEFVRERSGEGEIRWKYYCMKSASASEICGAELPRQYALTSNPFLSLVTATLIRTKMYNATQSSLLD